MNKITMGLKAGFIATLVLSAMMILKTLSGVLPQLDVIRMLNGMMSVPLTLLNATLLLGWIAHVAIGSVAWGITFAVIQDRMPDWRGWAKGITFGVGAWLVMMLVVMPMGGAGLFGMNIGLIVPVMTMGLHVVYGAVLGIAFERYSKKRTDETAEAVDQNDECEERPYLRWSGKRIVDASIRKPDHC